MAGALGDCGIVGQAKLARLRGHGMGLLDQGILKALRCLHRPQIGPINGACNDATGRPFHRVADGKARDHTRVVSKAAYHPIDEVWRDEGPGRIVDQHMAGVVLFERFDPLAAGFLASLAAGNRQIQLETSSRLQEKVAVFGGNHRTNTVDLRMIAKRLKRPIKDRFACNRLILLRPWATRPGAAACRHDDCNHCHMSPLTVRKRGGKEVA